jgi:hypothetical protein
MIFLSVVVVEIILKANKTLISAILKWKCLLMLAKPTTQNNSGVINNKKQKK